MAGPGAEPERRDAGTDQLEALRARLDRIDDSLLDRLRERIECCMDIALVKQRHQVPMMQPHRIGAVHQRAARYADVHGLDPGFLRRIYDLIIGETCRIEDLVIRGDRRP